MAQVRLSAVLTGLQDIAQDWADANYGGGAINVMRRLPSVENVKGLGEVFQRGSLQTLIAFYGSPIGDDAWTPGTPGDYLWENWTIFCDIYRPYVGTDAGSDAWHDFFEDFRAELASSSNIRAGQTPGIRIGPWQVAQWGTSNKGSFCWYAQLAGRFVNQPRSTV